MLNKTVVIGVFGVLLVIVILFFVLYQSNQNKFNSTPLAVVEKLVSVLYFNQGTYADYKSLFADKSRVITEQEFNNYEYKGQPDSKFPTDNDSVADVMKNMKEQQMDPNTVKVFWSTNPKDTAETAQVKWAIIKQNGKWFIRN